MGHTEIRTPHFALCPRAHGMPPESHFLPVWRLHQGFGVAGKGGWGLSAGEVGQGALSSEALEAAESPAARIAHGGQEHTRRPPPARGSVHCAVPSPDHLCRAEVALCPDLYESLVPFSLLLFFGFISLRFFFSIGGFKAGGGVHTWQCSGPAPCDASCWASNWNF